MVVAQGQQYYHSTYNSHVFRYKILHFLGYLQKYQTLVPVKKSHIKVVQKQTNFIFDNYTNVHVHVAATLPSHQLSREVPASGADGKQ